MDFRVEHTPVGQSVELNSTNLLSELADSASKRLQGTGSALKELGTDIGKIAANGPEIASNLLIGAKDEVCNHPGRLLTSAVLGGMYTFSVAAAAMVPRMRPVVSLLAGVVGVGLLADRGYDGIKTLAFYSDLLSNPSLHSDIDLKIQHSGAELANIAAGTLGGMAGLKGLGSMGRWMYMHEIPGTGVPAKDNLSWYNRNIPSLTIGAMASDNIGRMQAGSEWR